MRRLGCEGRLRRSIHQVRRGDFPVLMASDAWGLGGRGPSARKLGDSPSVNQIEFPHCTREFSPLSSGSEEPYTLSENWMDHLKPEERVRLEEIERAQLNAREAAIERRKIIWRCRKRAAKAAVSNG